MEASRGGCLGLVLFLTAPAAPVEAQFAEVDKLNAGDTGGSGELGVSVSIAGNHAVLGAWLDDELGVDSGAAYVCERKAGGVWSLVAKLKASDVAAEDGFGESVSISGDRALVGARGNDDLGSSSGSAYVFERDAAGAWTQAAKLLAGDGGSLDSFGHAVSISGDRALVGAVGDQGSAYVFERSAAGDWTQVAKLEADDALAGGVAILGERALVGASAGVSSAGSVYVFERNAAGAWSQAAKLTAGDGASGDAFGISVSLSGNRALVGARGDGDLGTLSGSAYVFEHDAEDSWTEVAKLLASDGSTFDSFGTSVSISGDRALVGAHFTSDFGLDSGSAYLFERDAGGTWTEVAELLASDGVELQWFGYSVSISGDHVLVGAPLDGQAGFYSGSGYVFETSPCGALLSASEVVRLGSPPNPSALLPGLTGGPVLGSTWQPVIDHTTFLPGAELDFLVITTGALNLPVPPYGTLLCALGSTVKLATGPAGAAFAVATPSDCVFAGAAFFAQGASLEAGTVLLTNALDVTIGTF